MRDPQYEEPQTIKEARSRMHALERDIMGIERQLSEPERIDRDGKRLNRKEYRKWRGSALSSRVFKKLEYAYLKAWIKERRRRVEAEDLDIFDADDPKAILVSVRKALRQAMDGDHADLGVIFNVVDQYLQHAA